jgi:hypothetical protein
MRFRHEVVDSTPPCGRLGICQPTDLTGNGRPDVIVGGLGSETLPVIGMGALPVFGRFFRKLETSIFWYENPGWERHALWPDAELYVFGNTLGDVTGNGRLDLLVGQGVGSRDIYWLEQPDDPRQPWRRRLVDDAFDKYHDLAFGDIDGDGAPELVGASQESEVVFYYDVPEDPTQSPWPASNRHVIARETDVTGLELVDIDGDGQTEVLAGTNIYRHPGGSDGGQPAEAFQPAQTDGGAQAEAAWDCETLLPDWEMTRIATGDIDGDGETEIVFSEGDLPHMGARMGRVGWVDPPDWDLHVLREDMYCPHTLQLADFDGTGSLDIYVAEMDLGENDDPVHLLFRNRGDGTFTEHVIDTGVGTHEAKAVDLTGNGRIDIVGKTYEPNTHVDVWYNES